ncbi:MAG: 2-phospho-L-lactate transferase [Burkholderiales bacterium]|nr:2-phospho-L-lactate transferase [Burkholderiales bacterium]
MIIALAGGVGGARLAQGLVQVLGPDKLGIVVNVGDDFEHLGLQISPDLDTVMYTLAGIHNAKLGWGRAHETWHFMETLEQLGGETWFRLGDRDLAVHVDRTRRIRAGETLSAITAGFCARLGIRHSVMPATDQRLRTRVLTDIGELDFQDYFVRRRCEPAVRGLRFEDAQSALPCAALGRLIAAERITGIVICPSNPWLSIAPIFAIGELSSLIDAHRVPVVAVSPIIAGKAVKGPASKIMHELVGGSDALSVVEYYGVRVDGWVIDAQDAALAGRVEAAGHRVRVTDTIMSSPERARQLAVDTLALFDELDAAE